MRRLVGMALLCPLAAVAASSLHLEVVDRPLDGVTTEVAKLDADDGAVGDELGQAVAMSGDTVIVGAPGDDGVESDAGSAYVFRHKAGVWLQEDELLPVDGQVFDNFGSSVAIYGDSALVGCARTITTSCDVAYVYARSGSSWGEGEALVPNEGGPPQSSSVVVALFEDTAVLGTPEWGFDPFEAGAAWVFSRQGGSWSLESELHASVPQPGGGFGSAVSIWDDTIAIGEPGRDDGTGAIYIFTRQGGAWVEQAILAPADAEPQDRFGGVVSLHRDRLLAGVPRDDENGFDSGSAYVFSCDEAVWAEEARLAPADGTTDQRFGWSASLGPFGAAVGAIGDLGSGTESGTAYIFTRSGSSWAEEDKFMASDAAEHQALGTGVAMEGGFVVVGAPGDAGNGDFSGAAYVFENPALFADGFESGDTAAWSATVP